MEKCDQFNMIIKKHAFSFSAEESYCVCRKLWFSSILVPYLHGDTFIFPIDIKGKPGMVKW